MKKAMKQAIFVAVFPLLFCGCAIGLARSVHQYSLDELSEDYHGKRTRPIEAMATQHAIFAATDTDFADLAHARLLEQCPHGRIVNITARYSTRLGFFAFDNVLKLHGTCVE